MLPTANTITSTPASARPNFTNRLCLISCAVRIRLRTLYSSRITSTSPIRKIQKPLLWMLIAGSAT